MAYVHSKEEESGSIREAFKSRGEETEAPFLISRPKLFGLEDTTRRKFQFEAVRIVTLR